MIKIIAFDLDGVLVKENCYFSQLFEKLYNVPHEEFYEVMKSFKMLTRTKRNESNFAIFHDLLERYKIKISEKEFFDLWLNNFKTNKDAVDIAISLKKKYKIAVISDNFQERAEFFRTKIKWFRDFDYSIFSSDIGFTKKSTEIFMKFLNDNKVSPQEVVYIDDDKENIETARSIGIRGVVFDNINQLKNDLKIIQENIYFKRNEKYEFQK